MAKDRLIIAAGAALAVAGLFGNIKTVSADAGPADSDLDAIYQRHGNAKGIDWKLIKAIAIVESNEQPQAVNPTDPSYGLMQVLCTGNSQTAHCTNKFPAVSRWNEATREKLTSDPDYNVHIGASILAWNLRTYGFPKGVAVYNNWSARNDPESGPFRNQGYVNKVRSALAGL